MAILLQEHRNRAHMTVRELAERAGVSADTVRRIERGDFKRTTPDTVQKIANALQVHPQDIAQFMAQRHPVLEADRI